MDKIAGTYGRETQFLCERRLSAPPDDRTTSRGLAQQCRDPRSLFLQSLRPMQRLRICPSAAKERRNLINVRKLRSGFTEVAVLCLGICVQQLHIHSPYFYHCLTQAPTENKRSKVFLFTWPLMKGFSLSDLVIFLRPVSPLLPCSTTKIQASVSALSESPVVTFKL